MIDLENVLEQLRRRKELVEQAIAQLEGLIAATKAPGDRDRRGRKSMGEAERQQVSSRMKTYWAKRRDRPSQSEP